MFFLNQIYYNIASPPFTWMVCPVTYSDLSDTKNSTQLATSLGEPIFPIGIFSTKASRCDSDKTAVIDVSIKPQLLINGVPHPTGVNQT